MMIKQILFSLFMGMMFSAYSGQTFEDGGVLFNKKEEVLRIIYKPVSQIMAVVFIPILIYFIPTAFEDVLHLLFSVSFLVIILNVAGNEKVLLRFENPILQYLGRISYGFYMFHVKSLPTNRQEHDLRSHRCFRLSSYHLKNKLSRT